MEQFLDLIALWPRCLIISQFVEIVAAIVVTADNSVPWHVRSVIEAVVFEVRPFFALVVFARCFAKVDANAQTLSDHHETHGSSNGL